MEKKLILALCGGTGSFVRFYQENPDEYDVQIIDVQEWLDGRSYTGDVRLLEYQKKRVYGITAGPPCTHFSSSGARWWESKGDAALLSGLAVADACCRAVLLHKPVFWVIENPVGRLRKYYGPPRLIWDPCDYGDPWTKRTCFWGDFNIPPKTPVEPVLGSIVHKMSEKKGDPRARRRSMVSPGMARAFFEANR